MQANKAVMTFLADDLGIVAALMLLNMSAACHAVDQQFVGNKGTVLNWSQSY